MDAGLEAGAFLGYKIGAFTLESELRREFAGGHGGTLLDLGARFWVPLGEKPWLRAKASTTWVDGDYADAFFSVNALQSANSGLREYDAGADLKNLSFTLTTGYDLTESWVIGAMVGYGRMLGDAADSPIVDDVGARDQFTGGIGLVLNF